MILVLLNREGIRELLFMFSEILAKVLVLYNRGIRKGP